MKRKLKKRRIKCAEENDTKTMETIISVLRVHLQHVNAYRLEKNLLEQPPIIAKVKKEEKPSKQLELFD